MKTDERKSLPMRESVHRRIKIAAAEAGLQMQEYVEMAVAAYSSMGVKENPTVYAKEKAIIEQALDLLPEYASSQIKAIEALLEANPDYKVKDEKPKKTAKVGAIAHASGRG